MPARASSFISSISTLPGAAGGEITVDLGFPFRLVALGKPRRQLCLLVFGQIFDCVLDLSEAHNPIYLGGLTRDEMAADNAPVSLGVKSNEVS